MYTSGHTKLLNKALALLYLLEHHGEELKLENEEAVLALLKTKQPQKLLNNGFVFEDSKLDHVNIRELSDGLKYPDFPCGTYELQADGNLRFKPKICSMVRLADEIAVLPEFFSISYSSHNGYFSLWHAMTYDPMKSVAGISREVIDQILSLCKLALHDETLSPPRPNAFWLGMALHTIMDAYSPAHVVRKTSTRTIRKAEDKDAVPSPQHQESLVILRDLKQKLLETARTVESEDASEIDEVVEHIMEEHKLLHSKTSKEMLMKLAKFFYFHNHQVHEVKELIGRRKPRTLPKSTLHEGRAILKYYYYPSQKSSFHKKHDLISRVKKYKLYYPCILDTCSMIRIYKHALYKLVDGRKTEAVMLDYLLDVLSYLKSFTFCH